MLNLKLLKLFRPSDPVHILALGFGSGLVKKAPGTAGTLASVPLYLLVADLTTQNYLVLVSLMCLFGIWICGKAARDANVHDHPAIVWDEFCGFFITMIMITPSWQSVTLGFVLFRFFDIIKPWPIKWIDKKVEGGFGIMFDDILAGFFSWIIMALVFL